MRWKRWTRRFFCYLPKRRWSSPYPALCSLPHHPPLLLRFSLLRRPLLLPFATCLAAAVAQSNETPETCNGTKGTGFFLLFITSFFPSSNYYFGVSFRFFSPVASEKVLFHRHSSETWVGAAARCFFFVFMIFPYLFHFGGIFYEDLCSCPSAREKGSSEGRAGRGVQVQFNRGGGEGGGDRKWSWGFVSPRKKAGKGRKVKGPPTEQHQIIRQQVQRGQRRRNRERAGGGGG